LTAKLIERQDFQRYMTEQDVLTRLGKPDLGFAS
jgi:hypothetical protein